MREPVLAALKALGIRQLLLSVHDVSFPGDPADDIGHGAPFSRGGRAFLRFVSGLGFHGLQLGPQGETTAFDPSPYDATLFTRSTVSIAFGELDTGDALQRAVAARPSSVLQRASHEYAHAAAPALLRAAFERQRLTGDLTVFSQAVAHEQHRLFRAEARQLGLRLSGDLQIGISPRDVKGFGEILLRDWRMGAPPSRTNPEGQAWGYGVLDPDRYAQGGLAFMRARARKLIDEYDGFRVDHPHGMIDPWVYADDVQAGARLLSSPERPGLARWAIARPEQIDLAQPPHGDGRVRELTGEQVDRYAVLFDALVREAGAENLIVEVLSTQPYPVRRVLERHGLGRFRVTQKASMRDASDVYRSENARPQDWIMVGTHDTEPIWRVAERWITQGTAAEHAAYLAGRLCPAGGERRAFAESIVHSAAALAQAQLADLFVGPARNVMIFFSDLLGLRETYNRPGTVSPENWTLRVPPDFELRYARAAAEGRALDLPAALGAAVRARGPAFAATHAALLADLDRLRFPAHCTEERP